MRAVRPLRGTALTALLFSLSFAPTAIAQFDDEFDDEFAEPAPAPTPAPAGGGFDDEFEEPAPAATTTSIDEDLEETGAVDEETPPAQEEEDDAPAGELSLRDRLFATTYNTYMGPTGGLHVVDAGGGATSSFRAQLALDFFFSNGFINPDDDAKHIGGSLSLSWTVAEFAEIWASIQSYANSNETGDPSLFQVLGDTQLGFKGFYRVLPFFTVGGDLSLSLLNTVGDIGVVFKSTSVGLRANAALDLRGLDNAIPFIARFNLQYYFDNSSNLIDDVEDQRFANLTDPADRPNEFRHLVTDVERYGLQINRTDFLNIGLGFEAPLRVMENFYLHPLLEWTWNIPVNRQGYNCLFIPAEPGSDTPAEGQDGCLDRQGVASFPMNLTLGLRIAPPVKGLSFLLAADIGLTGKKDFVRELAPNAPYNLYLGMSYAYDTQPTVVAEPVVREVERRVEVQLPPPVMGRIRGTVREQGAGTPVAGAIIAFPGRDLTALSASDAGVFTTYLLEPGEVTLAISHPEYESGQCAATIPSERPGAPAEAAPAAAAPADEFDEFDEEMPAAPAAAASASSGSSEHLIEVVCELVARPRLGNVRGRVVSGEDGAGVVGASVQINGPQTRQATTTADGSFTVQGLAPGSYTVRIDSDAFLIKMESVEVRPREDATPTITMVPRPRQALVVVRSREIQIRRQINFATNSADILPSSEPLMTEIADVFIRNPQITKVEIQGHTDNTGPEQRNRELSQQRADAVRQWLVDHGVAATRMEARGYGPDRPLVPNITPANRARNRRVQFVIQEQSE